MPYQNNSSWESARKNWSILLFHNRIMSFMDDFFRWKFPRCISGKFKLEKTGEPKLTGPCKIMLSAEKGKCIFLLHILVCARILIVVNQSFGFCHYFYLRDSLFSLMKKT